MKSINPPTCAVRGPRTAKPWNKQHERTILFNPPSNVATRDKTVPDLHLAEALGYERPTNIRALIKRHLPMLEAMGSLHQREAMVEAGKGARRSVTEYHLNRAQTAFLVAKSGTNQASR